jgi:hypothetical protein
MPHLLEEPVVGVTKQVALSQTKHNIILPFT